MKEKHGISPGGRADVHGGIGIPAALADQGAGGSVGVFPRFLGTPFDMSVSWGFRRNRDRHFRNRPGIDSTASRRRSGGRRNAETDSRPDRWWCRTYSTARENVDASQESHARGGGGRVKMPLMGRCYLFHDYDDRQREVALPPVRLLLQPCPQPGFLALPVLTDKHDQHPAKETDQAAGRDNDGLGDPDLAIGRDGGWVYIV